MKIPFLGAVVAWIQGRAAARAYLRRNMDVAVAVKLGAVPSAEDHFALFGAREGRFGGDMCLTPEQRYLASNPDVAAAVAAGKMPSGLHHWNAYGRHEHAAGRRPVPFLSGQIVPDWAAGLALPASSGPAGGIVRHDGGQIVRPDWGRSGEPWITPAGSIVPQLVHHRA